MCIENGKKQDNKNDCYIIIQKSIWEYFAHKNIMYNKKETPEDTIENFLLHLYKLIPVCKRKVHYSKELHNKIDKLEITKEHNDNLRFFENLFADGKDMTGFLSNNVNNLKKPDLLLYTWNIFHLHLSKKHVENTGQMKNNRSKVQLLCIITPQDVFFIDIINHPHKAYEYFDKRYLEIIANNGWMREIGFEELEDIIPETLEPKIEEPKAIFELISCYHLNLCFELQGKVYAPLKTINSNGKPYDVIETLMFINKYIHKLI